MSAIGFHSTKTSQTRKGQAGYSLLEVLIAVIVLSIGILGITGLQLSSKRSNFAAMQRITASLLAQEIIERIRSNPDQLVDYTNNGAGITLVGNTLGAVDCSAGCTETEIAQFDLYEWEQSLSGVAEQIGGNNTGGLPSPTACISGPVGGGSGTYSVAIAWRGMTKLSDPAIPACGRGSGRYDSDAGEADVYRRVLVVNTFINEPI